MVSVSVGTTTSMRVSVSSCCRLPAAVAVPSKRTQRRRRNFNILASGTTGLSGKHRQLLSAPRAQANEESSSFSSQSPQGEPPQRQVCNCGECDGEARIIGGMGAVPGFGWWPIKAYRPCPNYTNSGNTYQR